MFVFYKKTAVTLFLMLGITSIFAWFCASRFFVTDELFPVHKSRIPWNFQSVTDDFWGGSSSISVVEDKHALEYEYFLKEDVPFPYVIAVVSFADPKDPAALVNLEKYSTVTFKTRCSLPNVLTFYVHSFDTQVTDPTNFYTYRMASALFSCRDEWLDVEIDLKHLKVPVWWLEMARQDISDEKYWLDKVVAISFDGSRKGPVETLVKVKINELTFHGYNWHFLWIFCGVSFFAWLGYGAWLFRFYASSLIGNVQENSSELLSNDSEDAEKCQVLEFIAAEYANPAMNMDYLISTLEVSRTKVNDILKQEFGLTFSVYLNKLRLTEAARLLSQQREASVAEVAYSVGYNNVSYFNKLFKKEYGCTPKNFKSYSGYEV